MDRYRIEATWDEDAGKPVVDLEFAKLDPAGTEQPQYWEVCGRQRITDLELMTPKRVRAAALAYLAQSRGMVATDSFEMHYWQRAGRDALEQIEGAVGA